MKKKICLFLLIVCLTICASFTNGTQGFALTQKVYLGGQPAGFSIQTRGAFIAGLSDVITPTGIVSPSKNAGLEQGDVILFINGIEINSAADIERVLKLTQGEITVDYNRCGNSDTTYVNPATDINGEKKLGLFIRDDINGIGTVTFINGNKIATLGHPVLGENDELLDIIQGKIYDCSITGYVKGERGRPGELRGVIMKNAVIAEINKNTRYGVFGTLDANFITENLTEIEIGEAKMGDAKIYTTINGDTPQSYSISIVKTDTITTDTKNFVIKITDKSLLETTGGIVQGMSGSPIGL